MSLTYRSELIVFFLNTVTNVCVAVVARHTPDLWLRSGTSKVLSRVSTDPVATDTPTQKGTSSIETLLFGSNFVVRQWILPWLLGQNISRLFVVHNFIFQFHHHYVISSAVAQLVACSPTVRATSPFTYREKSLYRSVQNCNKQAHRHQDYSCYCHNNYNYRTWCFSVPPGKFHDSTLNYVTTASFNIFSNSLSSQHPTVYSLQRRFINHK
jgi:hypothetical protein